MPSYDAPSATALAPLALLVSACLTPGKATNQQGQTKIAPGTAGTIEFAATQLPREGQPKSELLSESGLDSHLYLRGNLPEPYGKARASRDCEPTWIPGWGRYAHASYVIVKVNGGEEITLDLDEVAKPYADQLTVVMPQHRRFFHADSKLSYPFSARSASYRFLVEVIPLLVDGSNQLQFTTGVRCMSEQGNAVEANGEFMLQVSTDELARLQAQVGPFLEAAPQNNLAADMPGVSAQLATLVPEFELLAAEPLDRGWTIKKNELGIPLSRHFFSALVFKEKSSGRCVANQAVTTGTYDGSGFTKSEVRLHTRVWTPFPCDNLEKRTKYSRPVSR